MSFETFLGYMDHRTLVHGLYRDVVIESNRSLEG
jgi:hypothetical protein